MEKIITTVTLRSQRVSPKKARLVMNLIKGKNALNALDILSHTEKKSADLALAALKSAIDSAKHKDFKEEELVVAESIAQEGKRMKRFFIRARGRSAKYQKRMSHLKISLAKQEEKKSRREKESGSRPEASGEKGTNGKKS
jgi:large subunit ribosomal protein L22